LPPARGGSHKQQVGNVCTCDQQHKTDCACQNQQRGFAAPDQMIAPGRKFYRPVLILLWVTLSQAGGDEFHLCLSGRWGLTLSDTSHDVKVTTAPALHLTAVARHCRPYIRVAGESEIRRHDADDCHRAVIRSEATANDIWIPTETPLPETMTEDDSPRTTKQPLLCEERAAQHWLDAESLEEIDRHHRAAYDFCSLSLLQIDPATCVSRKLLEGSALLFPIPEVSGRPHAPVRLLRRIEGINCHQP